MYKKKSSTLGRVYTIAHKFSNPDSLSHRDLASYIARWIISKPMIFLSFIKNDVYCTLRWQLMTNLIWLQPLIVKYKENRFLRQKKVYGQYRMITTASNPLYPDHHCTFIDFSMKMKSEALGTPLNRFSG